jgi:Holliday junction resolvase RusA-like endonuclease
MRITPVGKPRMTQRDKWAQRPAVMRYRQYCDDLRKGLGSEYELPEQLNLVFYLPMPKSWSEKKKALMAMEPHKQKPDVDNLAKAFMDAFKTDDSHVYVLHAEKFWNYEGAVFCES